MKHKALLYAAIAALSCEAAYADAPLRGASDPLSADTLLQRMAVSTFTPEECASYSYTNTINPDARYIKGKGQIIVAGKAPEVRAMQQFSWTDERVRTYAELCNLYSETFPGVRVYCMPVPLSIAYYCPDALSDGRQHEAIRRMHSYLAPGVTGVDIYPILGEHASEPIYSRTDHHWAPLGAYYAAAQLASQAGVPFLTIDHYHPVEVPDYVGTMYKFSRIRSVQKSPETFVYYVPDGLDYSTSFVKYRVDKTRTNVVSETDPEPGSFFQTFTGAATYCTFMGGDYCLTKVHTGTKNGRRILIIKDSFGNALAGYLFGSFEEIHVVDCRYYTKNMQDYVAENGITDIVFVNNLGHAISERTIEVVQDYLYQIPGETFDDEEVYDDGQD